LLAVRWYLRYGLSYRDLEELLADRGVEVDHVTLYRWVQRFKPSIAHQVPAGQRRFLEIQSDTGNIRGTRSGQFWPLLSRFWGRARDRSSDLGTGVRR